MLAHAFNTGKVIRWIARLLSLFSAVVLSLFVVGEPFPVSKITAAQWLGFAMFPVGVVIGFIVAWRREGLGGAITIGSLLAFYSVFVFLLNGNLKQGLGFILFAFPGLLFVISWLMRRAHNQERPI